MEETQANETNGNDGNLPTSAQYSQVDNVALFDIEEDGTNASETIQRVAMARVANDMINDRDAIIILRGILPQNTTGMERKEKLLLTPTNQMESCNDFRKKQMSKSSLASSSC